MIEIVAKETGGVAVADWVGVVNEGDALVEEVVVMDGKVVGFGEDEQETAAGKIRVANNVAR
jgi:hypothetical protein